MTNYTSAQQTSHLAVDTEALSRFQLQSTRLSSHLALLEARLQVTEYGACAAVAGMTASVESRSIWTRLADVVAPSNDLVDALISSLVEQTADTMIDQAWDLAEGVDRLSLIEAQLISTTLTPIFGTSLSASAAELPATIRARLFNEVLIPVTTDAATRALDPFVPTTTNGDPGGRFSERITEGAYVSDAGEPGRSAIVAGLIDTTRSELIRDDEFQLIHHGGSRYTAVLPGVIDLSRPDSGLHSVHTSVRDMSVATRSASSANIEDNLYAATVATYLERNVPAGSSIAIIGHSFGADTALDLAADPSFNGRHVTVTHVVAAAYHSGPQLSSIDPDTEVLVLQNERDLAVVVENLGHLDKVELGSTVAHAGDAQHLVRRFEGGWAGFGHDPSNYVDYLREPEHSVNGEMSSFFDGWAEAGYADDGIKTSIDISYRE